MKRREAIKGLTAFGALTLLPRLHLFSNTLTSEYIHFIGIGSTGYNTLNYLHKRGIKGNYTCIAEEPSKSNSLFDIKHLNLNKLSKQHHLNNDEISGNHLSPEIENIFISSSSQYIVISDLGSLSGNDLTMLFFNYLNRKNKSFVMISSLPFRFEGKELKNLAIQTTQKFKQFQNFISYDPEKIRTKYGNISLLDAFEKVNEELYKLYSERR